MGRLQDEMVKAMELKNYSPRTIEAYVAHMKAFTRLFKKSPAEMGEEEVRQYLHYLRTVKKVSTSNINIAYSALKFFYVEVLHRDWHVEKIPRPKKEKRLPIVLAPSEIRRLLEATDNLKYRVILMTIYSAGLRISEAAHLKITDIDSKRMVIRVEQGKGKRDRYTLLSPALLESLRHYYKAYRPRIWLFEGQRPHQPLGVESIQRAFRDAKKKPGS
jgi:site-specific recombinase XerD